MRKFVLITGLLLSGYIVHAVVQASPTDSLHIQSKGYKDREISLVNQSQAISIVMVSAPKIVASKPKKKKH